MDNMQSNEESRKLAKLEKTYAMPNYLIHAKYETTILEEYVMSWALAHSDEIVKTQSGALIYTFPASVIKEIIGTDHSHSFYDRLKETAEHMVGHTVGVIDPENHYFDYMNVIIRATYDKGKFSIYFNPEIPLLNLKKNYTNLSLYTSMSLESKYSIRLYKILQSKCYLPKGSARKGDYFEFTMSVAELRLEMGVVNAELPEVRKILRGSMYPDYEAAVEKSPIQKHKDWREFRRWVIKKAVDEINEKSEITKMHVEFKGRRGGKGAAIKTVDFFITILDNVELKENENSYEFDPISSQEKDMVTAQVLLKMCEIGAMVSIEEAQAIAKASGYNIYEVAKAIMTVKGSTTVVENKVGFVLSALKENYQMTRNQINKYIVDLDRETYEAERDKSGSPAAAEGRYMRLKPEDTEEIYEQGVLELPFDFKTAHEE